MKRFIGWAAIIVLAATAALGGWLYSRIAALDHERITDDVWMITGVGGNVAVLRTGAGAVIVDTMTFRLQGERIEALAEELTGEPVVIVINTHYHLDHTHGNPAFDNGVQVFATENTLRHLLDRDAEYWEGDASNTLPAQTFTHEHVIELGRKTIRLVHPGRGHTDGDLVALFEEDRIIHLGDLLFNGRYPNIDLEAGGTVRMWPATLDRLAGLAFDQVIPGHGPLTNRDGIGRFREFLVELWESARNAAERGLSLEQALSEIELTKNEGMEPIEVPFVLTLDRDFVVQRAWEEATGRAGTETVGDS